MRPETFPRFTASDGAVYTVRRIDRHYVVIQVTPGMEAARGVASTVAGPFESRHGAVAAAQRCARAGRAAA
jgi:hypothetical protein